ncbi:pilin [Actinocrispum wychmicini]|nr:pilin [Actinocrispum wychmicini]
MSAHYSPIRRRAARPPRRPLWILTAAVLALVLTAVPAHADTVVVALAAGVTDVLNNVRNWIMGILAGLATVFLSIGGVRYVMGSGDPGEIEKAKTAFKSAGWGYGLAALAPLIVEILKGIVGA